MANVITISVVSLIFILFIIDLSLKFGKKEEWRTVTSYIPTSLVTIGILGTFIGILIALYGFDTNSIDESVPKILEGMKTAFWSSIAGILFSLILRIVHSYSDDRVSEGSAKIEEDPLIALNKISQALQTLVDSNANIETTILKCFRSEDESSMVSQMKLIRQDMSDMKRELKSAMETFSEKVSQMATEGIMESLKEVMAQFNAALGEVVGKAFDDLAQAVVKLVEWQANYRKDVDNMQDELSQIIQKCKNATELINQTSMSISKIDVRFANIEQNTSKITLTTENLQENVNQLKLQNEQLSEFVSTIKEIGVEAKTVLPEITSNINTLTKDLTKTINSVSEKTEEITRNLTTSIEANSTNVKNLSENQIKTIDETLNKLEESLQSELDKSLTSLASSMAALSGQFAKDYLPITENLRIILRDLDGARGEKS